MRSRIAKEKSRAKKGKGGTGTASVTGTPNGNAQENEKRVHSAEQGLQVFIKEGILLYEFLIDRFQGCLLPPSDTQESASSDTSQVVSVGTIPAIHKLYIHLGDLHRYASSFTLAENAYLQASHLAPSKGNPYNQMAVVAQLKDNGGHPLPAVALYWYCRSLCAQEVFETSKSNVRRLFQANEKWLDKNGGLLKGGLKNMLNGCDKDEWGRGNKDQARNIKNIASQMFLSRFVAFHGRLFEKQVVRLEDEVILVKLVTEISEVNPFSDLLMIKLVAVNAFSFWTGWRVSPQVGAAAFAFNLTFGNLMGCYLEKVLEKTVANLEKGKKANNIRLLGPFLLFCEYISQEVSGERKNKALDAIEACGDSFQDGVTEFWKGVGKVATVIVGTEALSQLVDIATVRTDAITVPEDFKSLSKGFMPFAFLGESNEDCNGNVSGSGEERSAYVTPAEAVDALDLHVAQQTQSQMSQRSKKSMASEKSTVKSETETKIKLVRFMAFVSKHLDSGELVKTDDGRIEAAVMEAETDSVDGAATLETMAYFSPDPVSAKAMVLGSQEEATKDKDVLVYRQSEQGKPALLVPAFLLGEADEEKDDDEVEDGGSALLQLAAMIDGSLRMKQKEQVVITTTSSVPVLLNPSMMDGHAGASNADESKDGDMPANDQILPPMPPKRMAANDIAPVHVRPPPGFQPPGFCPPPMNPAPQATATATAMLPPPMATFRVNENSAFALPPHLRTMQQGQGLPPHMQQVLPPHGRGNPSMQPVQGNPNPSQASSILPPGFQQTPQPQAFDMLQTRNPFASRLTQSYGVNAASNFASALPTYTQNPNRYNNDPNTTAPLDQNRTGDFDFDHDPFGLRSLGIFSDDEMPPSRDTNSMQQQGNVTRNPFFH